MLLRACSLLLLAAGVSASAQTYAISLDRSVLPGQTYDLSGDGSSRQITSVGDRTLKSQEFQVSFRGQTKVQEIDKNGEAIRAELTVVKLTKTAAGGTVELLKPGTVVIADSRQTPSLTLKDGLLEEATQAALRLVYSIHTPDSATDDQIFGTKKLHAIGETWPVNTILAAEDFGRNSGLSLTPQQLNGNVTLVGIGRIGSLACAQVQGTISGNGIYGPVTDAGAKIMRAEFEAELGGCFPLLASAQSYTENYLLRIHLLISAPGGMQMQSTVEVKSNTQRIARGEAQ